MEAIAVKTVKLRDGTEIPVLPLDLDRFILLKDLIARLADKMLKSGGLQSFMDSARAAGGDGVSPDRTVPGLQAILDLLKAAGAEDVLDLLQALTGFKERETLRAQFSIGMLTQVLVIGLNQEGLNLTELLGEIRGSPGLGS